MRTLFRKELGIQEAFQQNIRFLIMHQFHGLKSGSGHIRLIHNAETLKVHA